jgi:hypothetical protein
MLLLMFADPRDYACVREGDFITLIGVEEEELGLGSQVVMRMKSRNGGE